MNWEAASFILGVLILGVQFFQAYITLGIKLWATEKFIAKDDMTQYISPLRETIQALQSEERLRHQR